MDYHVDLNYNNSTVYNVIDDLATWNEYFEAAQLYAENNKPFMTYKEWCDVNGYKIQE